MPTYLPPGHQRMAIWTYDGSAGTYTDNSQEARSSAGTAFTMLADTADYEYFGLENRFDMAIFFVSVAGSLGTLTWEYYDGDSWNEFVASIGYDFTENGSERFDRLNNWRGLLITATSPHTATPPDNITRYWIRCSTATVTTAPTINQIIIRQYAAYATASDVANILQLDYDFSADTIPTKHTVEDFIHNAQSRIDFISRKTWRPNVMYEEEHDFVRSGFQLVKNYPTKMLGLEIWNGTAYETKSEGRNNDYFLVPNTGMIYFGRFFILPARIQNYGAALWGWGWGEFSYPVRVSYVYGSNIFSDEREGGIVNDAAKKLAAIDILTTHDYSLIISSGSDRMNIDRKVDMWNEEITERLEELRAWEFF